MQEIKHIGRLIRIAEHALAQEVHKHHKSLELTPSQGFVLGFLTKRELEGMGPTYPKDVEQHFSVRHSTVSGLLQRLESKGFLTLEADDGDRRCKRIVLTKKAMEIREAIDRHIRASEEKIFRGMTADEIETFVRLMQQAAKNLGGDPCKPIPLNPGKEETAL